MFMSERAEPKKRSRTLSLSVELEEKLLKLCEQLGVNPHAYLVTEVGKAVNRDYLQFQTANNTRDQLADFIGKMELAMQNEMASKDKD